MLNSYLHLAIFVKITQEKVTISNSEKCKILVRCTINVNHHTGKCQEQGVILRLWEQNREFS